MNQEIFIGIIVAIGIAVLLGIKSWGHRVLTFKMDESSILKFFKESSGDFKFRSTEAISAGTNISTRRVSSVCIKSKSIQRNAREKESWCLK